MQFFITGGGKTRNYFIKHPLMKKENTVLCLLAHPDDAEFQCAGTLALLAQKGWNVVIATMTPGQAGSASLNALEISEIRRRESATAAAMINGSYRCLEDEDLFILYDRPTLVKATTLFRQVTPRLVITASPCDYIVDHEVTSRIARTACISAAVPNIIIEGTEAISNVPHLYYCAPIQGKDFLGNIVESSMYVDISSTYQAKEDMLSCHASQRDWLLELSKVDSYIRMMKDFAAKSGEKINAPFAEGFRQHLGFSYPTTNLLQEELGDLLYKHNSTNYGSFEEQYQ
jgi:LmbE family N-acetylglucosaminyl deacetylase